MGARNRVVSAVVTAWLVSSPGLAADHEPGRVMVGQGNTHLQSPGSPHPPYNSLPPTSGSHVPWLARWGVHRIPIPWEVQVHNLEDGGVIIHYRCDRPCPETVAALERIVAAYPTQVIAAPEPKLSSALAVTAWERLLTLDQVDEAALRGFIDAYRGRDHHPLPLPGTSTSPAASR
ncbi:MAG: DUF3105 domain-containing protein [Nitrospirota bacterium]